MCVCIAYFKIGGFGPNGRSRIICKQLAYPHTLRLPVITALKHVLFNTNNIDKSFHSNKLFNSFFFIPVLIL